MLVRHMGAVALTLVCLVSATAGAATAAPDATAKRQAAKDADHDGYLPALAKAPAAIVAESEPNDTPAQAQSVSVSDMVDASVPDSDVDWFSVETTAGAYLTVSTSSIDGSNTDTVLEAFASDGTARLDVDDDAGMGLFSAIQHLEVPGDGIVLLRVPRFGPLGDDAYRLTVEPGTAPPPVPANDTPATATDLEVCATTRTGSTVGASSAAGAACVEFDPLGGDVFYTVELPYSYQLTVLLTPDSAWDPSVYVFTDPADPMGSCLVGADVAYAGESETVIYTNESVDELPMQVYIGVDSWEGAQNGTFTLQLNCDFVVGVESGSWSGLKARFGS